MGDRVPADERDVAFIPALCDQLDDVYRRYVKADPAAIDDETRGALQRSLQLLLTAEPGLREVWLQARVGRAIRQTNEILKAYADGKVTTLAGEAPVPLLALPDHPSRGTGRGARALIGVLVVALAGALVAAGVFYSELHSARTGKDEARHQAAAAEQTLAGVQAELTSATSNASGARTQLNQTQAELTRLRSELTRDEAQLARRDTQLSHTGTSPQSQSSLASTQQALASDQAQLQHQNNVIQALVVCANDDSAVINDELGGNGVAAGQALQVANQVCQSAVSGG